MLAIFSLFRGVHVKWAGWEGWGLEKGCPKKRKTPPSKKTMLKLKKKGLTKEKKGEKDSRPVWRVTTSGVWWN